MESRCVVRRSERRFTNSLKRSRICSSIGRGQGNRFATNEKKKREVAVEFIHRIEEFRNVVDKIDNFVRKLAGCWFSGSTPPPRKNGHPMKDDRFEKIFRED
jgi:hypothetical protein